MLSDASDLYAHPDGSACTTRRYRPPTREADAIRAVLLLLERVAQLTYPTVPLTPETRPTLLADAAEVVGLDYGKLREWFAEVA